MFLTLFPSDHRDTRIQFVTWSRPKYFEETGRVMAKEGQLLQAIPVSLLKEAVSAQPSIEWFAPTGDYNAA
jgi:hypothetical protein